MYSFIFQFPQSLFDLQKFKAGICLPSLFTPASGHATNTKQH